VGRFVTQFFKVFLPVRLVKTRGGGGLLVWAFASFGLSPHIFCRFAPECTKLVAEKLAHRQELLLRRMKPLLFRWREVM